MKCKKCKKEIDDDSVYCKWCGAAQAKDKKKKMYQRPDGLYEKIVVVNGKRVPFRGKTENEVYKKMAEYSGEAERGIKFVVVAEKWSDDTFKRITVNSLKSYKSAYKSIVEHFNASYVKEITISDIQKYMGSFIQKGFAYKTVKNYMLVLSLIFKHAVIMGEIDNNPCLYIKVPNNLSKTKRNAPTIEELEIITKSVSAFKLFPLFLLYTGCRLGEALAVTGSDIDYEKKILTISKSVYFEGTSPKIKSPKTAAGIRKVLIPDVLFELLPKLNDDQILFSSSDGELLHRHKYDRLWDDYRTENNLKITPHQLRHGYATLLFESGVDMKDAQHMLGHANLSTTMDIYTHLSQSKQIKTFEKFNTYIKNTQ